MTRKRRKDQTAATARFTLVAAALVCLIGWTPCFADGYVSALTSLLPVKTIESVCGPILPCGGIGGICNTFRSEFGSGAVIGRVGRSWLSNSDGTYYNLESAAYLDPTPLVYDIYGHLRLWRFGVRGSYAFFENRSRKYDFARIDLTGFSLRGQFDLIQLNWLWLGPMADVYFQDPVFQGTFYTNGPQNPNTRNLLVKGERPISLGAYMRFMPPDILGIPVHFEAWAKTPYKGAKLTAYGASLVFRPQMYRFDLAARLYRERTMLKFGHENNAYYEQNWPGDQKWQVDMEWDFTGIEMAVYF